jgi:hypothetical protein
VLALLPYQTDDRTFVLAAYVMTRNILDTIPTSRFVVKINNVNGASAQVSYFDPLNDSTVPFEIVERTSSSLTVVIPASDSPYLLRIQE